VRNGVSDWPARAEVHKSGTFQETELFEVTHMATITRVSREAGSAYKAVIRLQGITPFSKTFRLRKDAKAWAERMERNIDEANA
jgi:hypothetical protein